MAERLRRVTKAMRATTLGALIAFSSGAAFGTLAALKISPERPLEPPGQADCLTVDSETLKGVYRILDQPGYENAIGGLDWQYSKQQAENYGLTLVDSKPHVVEISELGLEPSSVDKILAILNDFSSHFGFSVDIPEENIVVDESPKYYALSRESIDLEYFKRRALKFVSFFSFIPVELVRLSGMKHMVLVDAIASGAAGVADNNRKSIFIARGYFNNNVIAHEMSHLIDAELCGTAAGEDSEFRKLNPKGFKYGQKDEKWIDKAVVDIYGQEGGVLEDKATMLARIIHQYERLELDFLPVEIKSKLALILDRLEERIPYITPYLISMWYGNKYFPNLTTQIPPHRFAGLTGKI